MKIQLVVSTGAHQGKIIAVPGTQFIIGRDEGCHLRPASPAISKKHCAVFIKNDQVFVRDMGSTNGTFVNDELVQGDVLVKSGDRLRAGPLDFVINLLPGPKSDSTPLPDALKAVTPPTKPASSTTSKPVMPKTKISSGAEDQDAAAAMLLGMGDEDPPGSEPKVPDGSTVMEMSAVDADKIKAAAEKAAGDKKGTPTAAETSAAASEILRKYMRRPK